MSARSRPAAPRSSGTSGCGVHDQAGALLRFAAAGFAVIYSAFFAETLIDDDKSGIAGGKLEAAAVEFHHRLGEAQAEARARLRAALLQPHEALGGALAVGLVGNARTVVGDRRPDLAVRPRQRRPGRVGLLAPHPAEYLMALSTMLDSAWPISSRLPVDDEGAGDVGFERHADLLGHRLVELDHVAHGGGEVDPADRFGGIAGFEPRDHQDGVEGADQLVGFGDRAFQRLAVFRRSWRSPSSAASARLRSRVSGVFRSWAMLSETCFSPSFRSAIRASMTLRFSDRRSNSSPAPVTGSRPLRSPPMMRRLASETLSMRFSARRPTKNQISQRAKPHHAERRHQRVAHDDAEPLRLAEIAADQHDHLVGQARNDGDRRVRGLAALAPAGSAVSRAVRRRPRRSAGR